jgi:hypothetical protein
VRSALRAARRHLLACGIALTLVLGASACGEDAADRLSSAVSDAKSALENATQELQPSIDAARAKLEGMAPEAKAQVEDVLTNVGSAVDQAKATAATLPETLTSDARSTTPRRSWRGPGRSSSRR